MPLYEDTDFPANRNSLGAKRVWNQLVWKRPHEIVANPVLIKDGYSVDDELQGYVGDCWWLSSVAALCCRWRYYLDQVIPEGQGFTPGKYNGSFRFKFWRFGKWTEVTVDDRLPCYPGNGGLAFGRSRANNEFWLPLLEKAYAKLHGNYKAIAGGFETDGLEDLTGGVAVRTLINSQTSEDFFSTMLNASKKRSFICCGISAPDDQTVALQDNYGLVNGHAYTVMEVAKVPYTDGQGQMQTANLVKVRNPWGSNLEWKRQWSDYSAIWNGVSNEVKQRIGYEVKGDGEWWMTFDDLKRFYSDVTICTIGPDFGKTGASTLPSWYCDETEGTWSTNSLTSQYYVHYAEADNFDVATDAPSSKGKVQVLIGLMQDYMRKGDNEFSEYSQHDIQLYLYQVDSEPSGPINLEKAMLIASQQGAVREAQITKSISPGHYVIVARVNPTLRNNESRKFLVRPYSEKYSPLKALK